MADIKNKNELKRRINLFLDELDYSINEKFCKETMKMMREFIGHASHRLDCEDSRVKSLKKKLKEYKDLDEQGLLLRLPVPIGTTVYKFEPLAKGTERYIKTTITRYEVFGDSIWFTFANGLGRNIEDFGKYVFLTQEEAEQKLNEIKGKEEENYPER